MTLEGMCQEKMKETRTLLLLVLLTSEFKLGFRIHHWWWTCIIPYCCLSNQWRFPEVIHQITKSRLDLWIVSPMHPFYFFLISWLTSWISHFAPIHLEFNQGCMMSSAFGPIWMKQNLIGKQNKLRSWEKKFSTTAGYLWKLYFFTSPFLQTS